MREQTPMVYVTKKQETVREYLNSIAKNGIISMSYKEIADNTGVTYPTAKRLVEKFGFVVETDTPRLKQYVMENTVDGYIAMSVKDIADKTGYSLVTVRRRLKKWEIKAFDDRALNGIRTSKKDRNKEIFEEFKKNPYLTYDDIGKKYGISRQRVEQIVRNNIDRSDKLPFSRESMEKMEKMLEYYEMNPYEKSLFDCLRKFDIGNNVFYKYLKMANDIRAEKLQYYYQNDRKKRQDMIVSLLKETDLTYEKIAKECNLSMGFVQQINRKYNVRPILKRNKRSGKKED